MILNLATASIESFSYSFSRLIYLSSQFYKSRLSLLNSELKLSRRDNFSLIWLSISADFVEIRSLSYLISELSAWTWFSWWNLSPCMSLPCKRFCFSINSRISWSFCWFNWIILSFKEPISSLKLFDSSSKLNFWLLFWSIRFWISSF